MDSFDHTSSQEGSIQTDNSDEYYHQRASRPSNINMILHSPMPTDPLTLQAMLDAVPSQLAKALLMLPPTVGNEKWWMEGLKWEMVSHRFIYKYSNCKLMPIAPSSALHRESGLSQSLSGDSAMPSPCDGSEPEQPHL